MDNLTHSLVGALMGQAGLKQKTGLAMPALIIGANIPDIDATCTVYGIESLAMRRGLTHGPIAWVVLPLILAALLYGFDRWQASRGRRPESRLQVHFGWLFALSLLACLSHPALDWLNNYGIRLLEPFSHRWFYGDAIFIIDIWLWLGMGTAVWLSWRRSKRGEDGRKIARIALACVLAYIAGNIALSRAYLPATIEGETAIVSPVPIAFWQRDIAVGSNGIWRMEGATRGEYPLDRCDLDKAARKDPDVAAFLFWSRAPMIERIEGRLTLLDARYASPMAQGRFSVSLPDDVCGLMRRGFVAAH
ncbi:metal-dependent hydrolase [Altericroceibacterium endophyticum]|uniref:Metal-dependent hydrolase n=1 Tax=Altericroceibacterium endophyticum TaxID=1808508 RepID=A0A6I4T3W7_9SPHN|nr:metal-dependent hydrolase [Altericroceibacterium endophyticum]MXO64680.1 metal-dependent hydrolase [Altericroceibacterium endophyticum]